MIYLTTIEKGNHQQISVNITNLIVCMDSHILGAVGVKRRCWCDAAQKVGNGRQARCKTDSTGSAIN
jgi:hypothetical protein